MTSIVISVILPIKSYDTTSDDDWLIFNISNRSIYNNRYIGIEGWCMFGCLVRNCFLRFVLGIVMFGNGEHVRFVWMNRVGGYHVKITSCVHFVINDLWCGPFCTNEVPRRLGPPLYWCESFGFEGKPMRI